MGNTNLLTYLLLTRSKLNIMEILVSQSLIDMEIIREEFNKIMKEKKIREDERKCEEYK